MIAQQTEIRTSDGISDGFIYSPRESSRVPGIIFLTDIVKCLSSRSTPRALVACLGTLDLGCAMLIDRNGCLKATGSKYVSSEM